MTQLTCEEIEIELRVLTQKHVLLAGLVGLLIGLLQENRPKDPLIERLSLLIEQAKPLTPNASPMQWDALFELVKSFSEATYLRRGKLF